MSERWNSGVAQTEPQPGQWTKQILKANIPEFLNSKEPIISAAGKDSKFLGRVIIEYYEIPGAKSDADGVAYLVEAVNGDHRGLAKRVAVGFVARLLS
ncbi:MAG: hypothetical protein RMN52_02200 [Anaerolineae bacterium]|nr:hypothetical protein [Candidatus Roseilinea sp.]MDW8448792.1 hypothetical protein [Anaerolineae bacterium]